MAREQWRRFEAIELLCELLGDEIVVCNLGHPCQELYKAKDRPLNFYMLGSMGLASSIALGLALSTDEKVIAIEGDGALLMNLGSLATIAATAARNYVLLLIDNEAYGSTGFQPTFTGRGVDLAAMARAAGIEASTVRGPEQTREALREALDCREGPRCVVVKTETGKPRDLSVIPLSALEIKDRFMAALRGSRDK